MSNSDFPEKVTQLLRSGKQNLMVVAEGGFGKTVGLIEIYRRLLADPTSSDGRKLVPIYVPLAECESDRFAVRRYVVAHYSGLENIEDFSEWISNSERLLFDSGDSSYRYVFLLDAVNEHFYGDALVSEIEHISSYQNACVVLSSRTPNRYFSNWKTYRLNRLPSDIVDKVFQQAALDGEMKRAIALPFYLSKYRQLTESGYPMGEVINPATLMDAFTEWALQKQIKANSAVRFQLDTYAGCAKYAAEEFLPAICFALSCKKQMVFSRYDEEFVKYVSSWLLDDMPIELHSILENILVPMGYVISSKHGLYRIGHQLFRDYFASKLLSSGYEICQYNSSLLAHALSEHINSSVLEFFAMSFAGSTGKFLDNVNKMNHILSQDVACRKCGILQKNLVDMYALCGNTLRDVDLSNRDLRLASFDKFARLLHVNFAGSQFGADTFLLPSFSIFNWRDWSAQYLEEGLKKHKYLVFKKHNVLVVFLPFFYAILDMEKGNILASRNFQAAECTLYCKLAGEYDDDHFWYIHSTGISLVDVTTHEDRYVPHSEKIVVSKALYDIVFYRKHFIFQFENLKELYAFSENTGEIRSVSIESSNCSFSTIQDKLYVYQMDIFLLFGANSAVERKDIDLYQVIVKNDNFSVIRTSDCFSDDNGKVTRITLLLHTKINEYASRKVPNDVHRRFGEIFFSPIRNKYLVDGRLQSQVNIVDMQYDEKNDNLYLLYSVNDEGLLFGIHEPSSTEIHKLDVDIPPFTRGFVVYDNTFIVYTDSRVIQYSLLNYTSVELMTRQDGIMNILCFNDSLAIITKKKIIGYCHGKKWIKGIVCPYLSFEGKFGSDLIFSVFFLGDKDTSDKKAYFSMGDSKTMIMKRPFFTKSRFLSHRSKITIEETLTRGAIYAFSEADFSYRQIAKYDRPLNLSDREWVIVRDDEILFCTHNWKRKATRNHIVISLLKMKSPDRVDGNAATEEQRFYLPDRDFYVSIQFIDDEIVAIATDNISIFTLDGSCRLSVDATFDFKRVLIYRDNQMLYCIPKDKRKTDRLYVLDMITGELSVVQFKEKCLFWESTIGAFSSNIIEEYDNGDWETVGYDFWNICKMPTFRGKQTELGDYELEVVWESELHKIFSLYTDSDILTNNVLSNKEYLTSISAACMERRNFAGKVLDTYYAFTHEVTGSNFRGVEGISDMDRDVLKQYGAAEV